MAKTREFVFVYNANSGYVSALLDGLHKHLRPATYPCSLCAMTYGSVKMKRQWKNFIEDLPHEVRFLHKDEFENLYPDTSLQAPAMYERTADGPELRIGKTEIEDMEGLDQLIDRVKLIAGS